MHPGLTKTFTAGGAIPKRRLVKLSADGVMVVGAAATDLLMGVSDMSADVASGDRVDVRLSAVAEVELGATVTRGNCCTSDSVGRGVQAAPGAGVNNRYVGFFLQSGVVGDIVDVLLDPGVIQG
jgi:hypothetical protein